MHGWDRSVHRAGVEGGRRLGVRGSLTVAVLAVVRVLGEADLAFALDATKRVQDYVLDQWDARHGLPFTTVRAIRQTPDGYLWLATQSGLVRFDGAHFTVFDVQNTPELGHNHVWSLAVGRDGGMWIGSNRGLSRWQRGALTRYEDGGLLSGTLRALYEGRDGSLWIGSANGGLDRWRPTPIEAYNLENGLSGDSVLAVTEDGEGTIWIGTNRGLDRLDGGTIRHANIGGELIWNLLTARDGSVWVGTEGGGIWHGKNGAFRQYTTKDGLPGNEVRILLEDRDGNVWAGTNYGLGRFTDGHWSRLGTEDGLSTSLVRSLYEDADGSLWIGFYGGGLSRLRDGEFTSVSAREGLVHDLTWGIGEGSDGSLWVSTHAGVSRRKNGRWTTYTVKDGLPDNIVRPLFSDRAGDLWAGTNKGVCRFLDGRWVVVPGIPGRVVQSIYQGKDGALWFGSWEGLYRLRNGRVDAFQSREAVRNDFRAILEDRNGTIWVGATRGLGRLEGGTIVPFRPDAPWSAVSVEAIHEDAEGSLWVGTDGAGLFRLQGDKWSAITTRDGLFDDTVFHILEDDRDNLWLGGPRGIFRVGRRSLVDFVAGRSPRVSGALYGVAHGMKSSECTGGGSQPGAYKDSSGQLWFPTNRGVVMIDPHRAGRSAPPPAALIEEIRFDRRLLGTFGEVVAGPGRGDLEVRYAAVNFISPADVRFRYRLEGFDASWVEAADRRVAHYANLAPGPYRFVVSASNDGVAWSPEETTLHLRLLPRFHQTGWFRGLVVVGIGIAGLGLHRLRVRRLAGRAAELLAINEALRESEERYAVAARGGNDGLWDWNLKTGRVYYSPRWKSMLGHAEAEVGDGPDEWLGRIHPEDQAGVREHLNAHLSGASSHFENEHRIRHKSGEYLFVLSRGLVVRDAQGENVRLAGSQTDITLRKQAEAQILHDALHDPLTGLPNRTLFLDRLGQALARRHRHAGYRFAVLFLDLDRFKLVNDSLGHPAGDELLVGLARRLSACLRDEDTVARLGGDEFALLLDNIPDARSAARMAERIREELRQPFVLGGHEVFSTASIGITFDPEGDRRPEDLLRDADTALYRAKALGRDRHELFDEGMHSRAVAILKLETDLRRALERQELALVYQPIISLETGGTVGFEALVRWRHPERGLLSPDEFIPLAEETGLIVPLGEWVLREACGAARAWQDAAPRDPGYFVSVNLSVREFSRPDLVERVRRLLEESGLRSSSLRLEITESLIMDDPDAAVARCRALRELGVGIDIDDFGTGYSSLSYLRRFPVDALKIDRSFVSRMDEQAEDLEIVRAIVSLAATLRIGTVAEGVETREQAAKLRSLGCVLGQGYLFARPLEREQALALAPTPAPR